MRITMLAVIAAVAIVMPLHAADAKGAKVRRAEYTQLRQSASAEPAHRPTQKLRDDKGIIGPSGDPECKTLLCNNFILIGVGF